jgi:ketosteroid isomerase-like protein
MARWQLRCLAALALLVLAGAPARANEQQIRDTLARWTEDFNARRVERICGLFASELRYDYRGFPERGYREMCELLNRSLTDPQRRFSYAFDIKDILVSGDLAAVRLVWTLTVTAPGSPATSAQEYGLDVFRRQADGSWKIIRYLGYEAQ